MEEDDYDLLPDDVDHSIHDYTESVMTTGGKDVFWVRTFLSMVEKKDDLPARYKTYCAFPRHTTYESAYFALFRWLEGTDVRGVCLDFSDCFERCPFGDVESE